MDYEMILNQLVNGEIPEYRVSPADAFSFQAALREFGKRKEIIGTAQRNGDIVYVGASKA